MKIINIATGKIISKTIFSTLVLPITFFFIFGCGYTPSGFNIFMSISALLVSLFLNQCNLDLANLAGGNDPANAGVGSGTPSSPDTTAPGVVTGFTATNAGTGSINLTWTNPVDADLAGVLIMRKIGSYPSAWNDLGATQVTSGQGTSYTDLGLVDGTTYYYSIFAYDNASNYSAAAQTSMAPSVIDNAAPAAVTGFTIAITSATSLTLSWTNPGDLDFAGVKVLRKTGSYPTSSSDAAATQVYSGNGNTKIDSGLTTGTTYYYAIYSYDAVPNYSTAAQASQTPALADIIPPSPVTGFTISAAGSGSLNLSWTNPTDGDFAGVKVLRKTGGFATSVNDAAATLVYAGIGTSFADSLLTNGTVYYYSIFAYDGIPNYSAAAEASAQPPVTWTQDAFLKASNDISFDNFGHSVAISGNIIAVGAPNEDSQVGSFSYNYTSYNYYSIYNTDNTAVYNNNLSNSGAVYVFQKDGLGNWFQDAFIKASNADSWDYFGSSVAVSGNIIAVGAFGEYSNQSFITNTDNTASVNNLNNYSGAVYVFQKDISGNWFQDAYIKASNNNSWDNLGSSVAISGNTIVAGAPAEDSNQTTITNVNGSASIDNSAGSSGAVYVFQKNTYGNWYQDAYLKASDTAAGDQFGDSVSISGNTIVVGSKFEDSNQTTITNTDGSAAADTLAYNSGAVYLFQKDANGNWFQDAYLKASNAGNSDNFGGSVAIAGNIVAVGATYEGSNQLFITNTDGSASPYNTAYSSGAVYVFQKDGLGNWFQDAYVKASNTGAGDNFGSSVAVSGNTVVVGAIGEDSPVGSGTLTTTPFTSFNVSAIYNTDGSASNVDGGSAQGMNSGAVYVFKKNGAGDWYQDAYMKASNAEAADNFGNSVAVDGNTIVTGAKWEDSSQSFVTNTNDTANTNNTMANSGAVYVFQGQ